MADAKRKALWNAYFAFRSLNELTEAHFWLHDPRVLILPGGHRKVWR